MVVTDWKVDLDSEALPMKEDLKTAANGACDNRKRADGEEIDENFIVIEANREIDRC
jgi:hypothetical protein